MCESTDSSRTTTCCRPRCPLSISGLSCFLLPTSLCSRQREVGAAPHRGNANRPLTNQGKAKAPGTLTKAPRRQKNLTPPHHAQSQTAANKPAQRLPPLDDQRCS